MSSNIIIIISSSRYTDRFEPLPIQSKSLNDFCSESVNKLDQCHTSTTKALLSSSSFNCGKVLLTLVCSLISVQGTVTPLWLLWLLLQLHLPLSSG